VTHLGPNPGRFAQWFFMDTEYIMYRFQLGKLLNLKLNVTLRTTFSMEFWRENTPVNDPTISEQK